MAEQEGHSTNGESPTPPTSRERLAAAASSALQTCKYYDLTACIVVLRVRLTSLATRSTEHFRSKYEEDAEKARRRINHKAAYDKFTGEAETTSQKAFYLASRNDIWDENLERVEAEIEACKEKLLELEESKSTMEIARQQLNEQLADDVDQAKENVDVQQKWDDYFDLRSDEAPR